MAGEWIEPRARILQWRELLTRSRADDAGLHELLTALREDSEDAAFLREFAPVPVLLAKSESREFYRECAYSH